MSRFVFFLGATCTLVFIGVFFIQPTPHLALPAATVHSNSTIQKPNAVTFHETSLDWKVVPVHQQSSEHLTSLTETMGSGICALDVNKDGWMDLFFVGGSGHTRHYGRKAWWHKEGGNRLLLNVNGQYFQDMTEQAGLKQRMWGMGCATADLNNDGLTDLLITGVGSNQLYRNQGNGSFIEVTASAGISNDHWSTGASLGDFNNDGLIDIYISNYILYEKGSRTFERTSGFRSTTNVAFDPTLYDPEPNRLYINQGKFVFEDVANKVGVSNFLGRSLGARWVDINQDNWLDLVVINDHNSPNQVFINEKGLNFSRGTEHYAPFEVAGAHDLAIGDFNNNGQDEFFMGRGMSHPPVMLSKTPRSTGNKNNSNGSSFTDVAWSRGLAQAKLLPFTAWGATAGDFNNDSFLDIYIANGMILPDIDSHFVPQAQRNSLFINNGDGNFLQQPATIDQQVPYSSRGAITVDLNNNGKLEVIISNNNNPLQIFENQAANNNSWLGLDLQSSNYASDVYGAIVEVSTDQFTLKRTLRPNQSFLSQSDPRIHIGLGESKVVKKLTIYWRDGQVSSFENLRPNQYFSIGKSNNSIITRDFSVAGDPSFESSLAQLNDQALINLSKALLQASPQKATDKLLLVWSYGSDAAKKSLLSLIEQHWGFHYLPIVRRALANNDGDIRLIAIRILKKAELESSIVWLIPILNDTDIRAQCSAAETFRFFFDEEEAVTHRKTLAISPLIRLLDSGSAEARICAAEALAASENKRAILPLLQLTSDGETEDVRSSAIRALGLIRDTSATEALLGLVKRPDSDASMIASALIALKRLNTPNMSELFSELFAPAGTSSNSSATLIKRYEILAYLFSHPDGIVFRRKKLEQQLNQLIQNSVLPRHGAPQNDQQLVVAVLQAIEAGKITTQYGTVITYVTHSDNIIRLQALYTLAALNTQQTKRDLETSLLKESIPTIVKVAEHSEQSTLSFSNHFIRQVAKQTVGEAESFNELLGVISHLPEKTANNLAKTLLQHNLTEAQYLTLLNLCSTANILLPIANSTLLQHSSPQVRYAYASCIFGGHSEIISSSNKIQLKKRIMLKSFLADTGWSMDEKNTLLIKAAETDSVIAKTMLLRKVETLSSSLQEEALRILAKHDLSSQLEPLLWKLLKSTQNSNELRLQAAIHLMPTNEDKVLDYLDKNFILSDD